MNKQVTPPKANFEMIWTIAHNAGTKAGTEQLAAGHGSCGFGWVSIKGNTRFAKWAKVRDLISKSYPSGYSVWVRDFNQCEAAKYMYASAFAKILNAHGIQAHACSRAD
jgi:hypothetical protein